MNKQEVLEAIHQRNTLISSYKLGELEVVCTLQPRRQGRSWTLIIKEDGVEQNRCTVSNNDVITTMLEHNFLGNWFVSK